MNVNWISYEGGTICINADKLPKAILVTEKDKRGREVYTARVHLFEERGECKLEEVDIDGHDASEYMKAREWCFDAVYKCSCGCRFGHVAHDRPRYCPNCGRKVVE